MKGAVIPDELLLKWIRECIRSGRYHFTVHALEKHPLAEGFVARDALVAIDRGTIVEQREDECRCLICGDVPHLSSSSEFVANYLHCLVQWDYTDGVVIITIYRPRTNQWVNQFQRRRK